MDFVWETVLPDSSLDAELVYLSPVYLVSYIKGPKRPRIKISIREYIWSMICNNNYYAIDRNI